MEHTGVWARLALLAVVLMLMCSSALAEEAALEILSCKQEGEKVVLDFVCLDENHAPVSLPLQPENWTVRGAESLTDMQVTDVRRYQGGVHYVFVYEASSMVSGDGMYTQLHCIEAMKACVDGLKFGDSMSVVQLGSQMQIVLNRVSDKTAIEAALGKLKKDSKGNALPLYDQVAEVIGQLNRHAGERTVMILMAAGIDKDSRMSKFELAQRLETAQMSVYPLLVRARNNVQNADGLEALCVRGGYMLRADNAKNKDEMIAALTALLPTTREAYTVTARAMDTSYNAQKEMQLRVYVRHDGGKISGEAFLTTDDKLYTVVEPEMTPTPDVPVVQISVDEVTPSVMPEAATATPAPEVPATPVAAPVDESTAPPSETVTAAESDDGNVLVKYALLAGGALVVLVAAVVLAVTVTRSAKKTKAKKQEAERSAKTINPQFGATKARESSAVNEAPVKTEKPVAPASVPMKDKPAELPTTNPADLFGTPPTLDGGKPLVTPPVQPQPNLDKTMDERQMLQSSAPAAWDQTMDERQTQQPTAWDKTMDERRMLNETGSPDVLQAVPEQHAWDRTMDERQAQSHVDVQSAAAPVMPVSFGAEQTVKAAPAGPQLVLDITDADGTREVSRPLLTGGEITLGRENTDILLDRYDHSISRQHMSIKLTASNLTVVDYSSNGTQVDGQILRHDEAKLTIGSELRLGGRDEAAANRITTVIRVKEFRYPGTTR